MFGLGKFFSFKKNVDYLSHPFFHKTENYMIINLDRIKLSSTSKENMVKEFMIIVIQNYKEVFQEYIAKSDQKDLDNIDSELVENLMLEAWKRYKKDAEAKLIPIDFINKFDTKYLSYFAGASKSFRQIYVSKLYSSKSDKFISILNILDLFLHVILINVIDTANEFNGELDKALKGTRFDTDLLTMI